MTPTRPIDELLTNVKKIDRDIAKARDVVQGLESLRADVIRSLRKAGYKDEVPTADEWDFSHLSVKYVHGTPIFHYFLMILAQADRWMSPRELYAAAKHAGVPETKRGDYKRSLAGLVGGLLRKRESDGFIGLHEWPDGK